MVKFQSLVVVVAGTFPSHQQESQSLVAVVNTSRAAHLRSMAVAPSHNQALNISTSVQFFFFFSIMCGF
jgi:hypothetical protein